MNWQRLSAQTCELMIFGQHLLYKGIKTTPEGPRSLEVGKNKKRCKVLKKGKEDSIPKDLSF